MHNLGLREAWDTDFSFPREQPLEPFVREMSNPKRLEKAREWVERAVAAGRRNAGRVPKFVVLERAVAAEEAEVEEAEAQESD